MHSKSALRRVSSTRTRSASARQRIPRIRTVLALCGVGILFGTASLASGSSARAATFSPIAKGDIIASLANGQVDEYSPSGTLVQTLISNARTPTGSAFDGAGNLYVTEFIGNDILKVDGSTGAVSVFSNDSILGDGTAFDSPESIAFGPGYTRMYVSDANRFGSGGGIHIIDTATGKGVGSLPLPSSSGSEGAGESDWLAFDHTGTLFMTNENPAQGIMQVDLSSKDIVQPSFVANLPNYGYALSFDANGNIWLSDTSSILEYDPSGKLINTITNPSFQTVFSAVFNPPYNTVYAGDLSSGNIFTYDLHGNLLNTFNVGSGVDGLSVAGTIVAPSAARYVALGDSVPYGHGLANPYPTAQIGLPATAVQQGPSDEAYPALVAKALHLTLSTRSTNCNLTGDDLTISGAKASKDNVQKGNSQCPGVWPDSESVQNDELPAAQLAKSPAELVTIQAGADDIRFGDCMKWELTKFAAWHAQGIQCVQNNAATTYFGKCFKWEFTQSNAWHVLDPSCVRNSTVNPSLVFKNYPNDIPTELANIRTALTDEIKQAAPYAKHIAVLNYYQVIPNPVDFKQSSIFPGSNQVDEACWGLSHNLKGAYNDAVILQAALNNAIAGAVSDAISAGVKNVQLIDISDLEGTHEICTGNPALFSGELMPKSQFYNDIQAIGGCYVIHYKICQTAVPDAEADLGDHTWRAAHPNTFGQQDIARAIESQLGSL